MAKKRRSVDLNMAVDVAREMIAVDGESALTMRGLADALEISPMAIYRHVTDRYELIDLVLDRALEDCIPELSEGATWQEQLLAYFQSFWSVMTLEPGLGAIAVTRPMQGPNMGRITDDLLRICREAGHADDAFDIIDTLLLYTFGAIVYDISRPATARKGIMIDESTPELELRREAYGERDPYTFFRSGVETVMLGLETRMARG